MRILLTGAGGQVGRALLPLLSRYGSVLTPTVSELDLSQPRTLSARLDELNPCLIINPAAYTAVDKAEDDRQLAFRVNAEGPSAIANWAAKHSVPIVHFSTDYVFDGSGTKPWREDDHPRPLSVYGASKLAGDKAIADAGCAHLIVRTSWVYAATGANFLRKITRLAREREELRIVADQIGAPTSAKAIATAVAQILPNDRAAIAHLLATRGGVLNVVCAGETSWYGFAKAILTGLRSRGERPRVKRILPMTTDQFLTKVERPANSRLDSAKLRNEFGVLMPAWNEALDLELDVLTAEVRALLRPPG